MSIKRAVYSGSIALCASLALFGCGHEKEYTSPTPEQQIQSIRSNPALSDAQKSRYEQAVQTRLQAEERARQMMQQGGQGAPMPPPAARKP